MKPSSFLYRAPATLGRALDDLAECAEEGGKVLAGGQSLLPMLNYRLVRPPVLVDLGNITELAEQTITGRGFRLGAMTTTGRLARAPEVRAAWPLLATAASWVGHVQIRSRGTIGGSVAHADPSAEMAATMLLADARITLKSTRGERVEQAGDFFLGYLSTTVEDDEILTHLDFEVPNAGGRWGFEEFAPRHGDFAEAGAALTLPADGSEEHGRAVSFGVADRPFRLPSLETLLTASTGRLSRGVFNGAVGNDFDAVGTVTAEKRDMGAHLVERALRAAGVAVD
ncbi:FAD binding domain-containing protein [Amycolatopsis panacis]|uniref:Xanthine dehydrogenase family protein subunit M n=1 Tax=Amycolatopsis panacis TaxID=2340917 RepID=A0A419HZP7_9PSEU|nr:FAD binding domain-containing protein [Amycolatopsis panacis]RJQ82674.1 xanthine dehydrogenase family protein subunit M [Amycolatopsis panacis]